MSRERERSCDSNSDWLREEEKKRDLDREHNEIVLLANEWKGRMFKLK